MKTDTEESFLEGYSFGWADSEHGFNKDAKNVFEEVKEQLYNFNLFIKGYNKGYEDYNQ
jgi:hypothetical protein